MKSPTKLLRECIRRLLTEEARGRHLRIFDFDDTLVKTDSMVYVTNKAGRRVALTPGEFAVYDKVPGDTFDYSDFTKLINPREIKPMMRLLHQVYAHHGPGGLIVLSARSSAKPIRQFMSQSGYADVEVAALDNAHPSAKADWISARLSRGGINTLEFFDDSYKNVAAVKALRGKHPDVRIIVHHVAHVPKRTKRR